MAADLATIQRLHPEWGITQVAPAPNGGLWAVGRDGGVFALNADGGTTGTVAPMNTDGPFSYTGLAPEQRVGSREFTGITATAGGYTLRSNLGEDYAFSAPKTTGPLTPLPGATKVGDTPAAGNTESGKDVFTNTLIGMGFTPEQASSLGGSIWNSSKTKSQDALYFDVINSPEYAARFPGMKALRASGTAINESQYVTLERQYTAAAKSAGLPEGFYDSHDDFGKLIANGVSPDEYASRVHWAQTAALSDPTFMDELARQVPGANLGDATAFYLDPDKGTEYLQQKTIRAQIGTSARTTGFGQLSQAEIDKLYARPGMSPEQAAAGAQAGFGALATQSGLFANTAEETLTDDQFTRDERIGVVAGDTRAQQELETRRSRRQANFQGGGGAAGSGSGRTGLG